MDSVEEVGGRLKGVSATSIDGVGSCGDIIACVTAALTGKVENGPSVIDRCAGGRPRSLPPNVLLFDHAEDTAGPWRLRLDEGVTADTGGPNAFPGSSMAENGRGVVGVCSVCHGSLLGPGVMAD